VLEVKLNSSLQIQNVNSVLGWVQFIQSVGFVYV